MAQLVWLAAVLALAAYTLVLSLPMTTQEYGSWFLLWGILPLIEIAILVAFARHSAILSWLINISRAGSLVVFFYTFLTTAGFLLPTDNLVVRLVIAPLIAWSVNLLLKYFLQRTAHLRDDVRPT